MRRLTTDLSEVQCEGFPLVMESAQPLLQDAEVFIEARLLVGKGLALVYMMQSHLGKVKIKADFVDFFLPFPDTFTKHQDTIKSYVSE